MAFRSPITGVLLYDHAGHILGEYSSTGALIQETIWMDDLPVATLRPSGSTVAIYYVHANHLGAPVKVTRPSDNGLMWRWDPDTFGSSTSSPNQNPAGLGTFVYNLRFPGQYALTESGLNYNYFRTYDPATGRYVESDPIGLAGGSMSTYTYVGGNPISNIDPLGLDGYTCFGCHHPPLFPVPVASPIPPNAAGAIGDEPKFVKFPDFPAANDGSAAKSCPDDECDKRLAELNALADVIVRMRGEAGSAQITFLLMQQNFTNKLIEFNTLCPQRRVQSTLVYRKAFPAGT